MNFSCVVDRYVLYQCKKSVGKNNKNHQYNIKYLTNTHHKKKLQNYKLFIGNFCLKISINIQTLSLKIKHY